MNTGLHDVWNLVWKLDLVVHGRGNEQLLDSYNAEQRPVIKQVIDTTHFLTKALGTPSKLAQLLRDTLIPMVSRLRRSSMPSCKDFPSWELLITEARSSKEPAKDTSTVAARRNPGIRSRFVLVLATDADSTIKDAAKQLAESFSDIVELRLVGDHGLALVRPDGYIAYSARDGEEELRTIRALLELQTKSSKEDHSSW